MLLELLELIKVSREGAHCTTQGWLRAG
jgi:hypothetical protein